MITIGHRGDNQYLFFAVSTDNLPAHMPSGQNIPVGTTLYITDQFQHLVWTGSAWVDLVEDIEAEPVYNPLLTAMADSLTSQNLILVQILSQLQLMNIGLGQSPSDAPPADFSISPLTQ